MDSKAVPIGLEKGHPSLKLSASSSYDANHTPEHSGLNYAGPVAQGWSSRTLDPNQWIQVDMGEVYNVVGFAIQGRGDHDQRVTSLKVHYAGEDGVFQIIPTAFAGPKDRNTAVKHAFASPVAARFVRLCPEKWESHISLRWEVYVNQHKVKSEKKAAPIGLEDGNPNLLVTASSQYDHRHSPEHCGLNYAGPASRGWASRTLDPNQWIQVDMGMVMCVTGFAIQGRGDEDQWVTACKIHYAGNDAQFRPLPQSFDGNKDRNTVVRHEFASALDARYIRLAPEAWHSHMALRWEVYATDVPRPMLFAGSVPAGLQAGNPNCVLTASTSFDASLVPEHGRLHYAGTGAPAWAAKILDQNQWIQVDLGSVQRVSGFATQGRADCDQWVTACKIQYQGAQGFHTIPRIFPCNRDRTTVVRNDFPAAIATRILRLIPIEWNSHMSMRWEVFIATEDDGKHDKHDKHDKHKDKAVGPDR